MVTRFSAILGALKQRSMSCSMITELNLSSQEHENRERCNKGKFDVSLTTNLFVCPQSGNLSFHMMTTRETSFISCVTKSSSKLNNSVTSLKLSSLVVTIFVQYHPQAEVLIIWIRHMKRRTQRLYYMSWILTHRISKERLSSLETRTFWFLFTMTSQWTCGWTTVQAKINDTYLFGRSVRVLKLKSDIFWDSTQ